MTAWNKMIFQTFKGTPQGFHECLFMERRKTLWLQRELCEVNSLTEVMSVESYFTLMLDSKVLVYCVNKKSRV